MSVTSFDMLTYAERLILGPRTAEERMHQDKTPEREGPTCANCGMPLPRGRFKWCSRQCATEDDGPYGPEDEDVEPEPEDEEPEEDEPCL